MKVSIKEGYVVLTTHDVAVQRYTSTAYAGPEYGVTAESQSLMRYPDEGVQVNRCTIYPAYFPDTQILFVE